MKPLRFDELASGVYLACTGGRRPAVLVLRITRLGHGCTVFDTALNTDDLASQALVWLQEQGVVEEHGATFGTAGWYPCPPEIADQATYRRQPYRPWNQRYGMSRPRRKGWCTAGLRLEAKHVDHR